MSFEALRRTDLPIILSVILYMPDALRHAIIVNLSLFSLCPGADFPVEMPMFLKEALYNSIQFRPVVCKFDHVCSFNLQFA